MSQSSTLVVPVDVRAFYVDSADDLNVQKLAGTTLDFSKLPLANTQSSDPPLICRDNGVLHTLLDSPLYPLRPGVHVHWNLPRALTHGQGDTNGDITFPIVPNRWLVTRLLGNGAPFTGARSWVIESDHISKDKPSDPCVTIFTGYQADQPFYYMGRAVDAAGWTEPEPNASQLSALPYPDLTVMQTGDPLFASFYPNCRNVFGFHDDLSDVGAALDGAQLLYVVVGWYSLAKNDPLNGGLAPDALLAKWKWQVPPGTTTVFTQSLYTGTVQTLGWQRSSYFPETPPPLPVQLSVGNNGAAAMAAMIGSQVDNDPPHRDLLENLLTALQIGALSDLHQPQPDRLAEMTDSLQAAGFGHIAPGTEWTLVSTAASKVTALRDLPEDLATQLAALNDLQAQLDAQAQVVDSLLRQLYVDWYRYGLFAIAGKRDPGYAGLRSDYFTYLKWAADQLFDVKDTANNGGQVVRILQQLQSQTDQAFTTLTAAAAVEGWALKALVAPWFWRPNDPVVVISGLDTGHRLQGNDADAPVLCRAADDLISSITIGSHTISGPASQSGHTPPVATVPVAIWDEAILLDATLLALAATMDPRAAAEGLQDFLADATINTTITAYQGTPPVADAIQWWDSANPWLPLFMRWTADYYPAPGYDGKMSDVPADYITGQFILNDDGSMVPKPTFGYTDSWPISGQAILTPLATRPLLDALSRMSVEDDLTADVQAAEDYLAKTPLLYQGLSGFHDGLLLLIQTPQLTSGSTESPPNVDTSYDLLCRVDAFVGNLPRLAAEPYDYFVPMRGGHFAVDLMVADVFGQIRNADVTQLNCAPDLRPIDPERPKQAYLPPRFSQPARLTTRFLSAVDDRVEATLLASPLCGWLLPNNLDDALAVYDQDGVARGMLDVLNSGTLHWMSAPGSTYGESLDDAMTGANPHQIALVQALNGAGYAFVNGMMKCLEQTARTITGSIRQDPSLAILIGSPIALVQMVVQLDLLGGPALNQIWDALKKDVETTWDQNNIDTITTERQHNNLEQVQIDVLVGAGGRFRDGVLGFFLANAQGDYDFGRFYSPDAGMADLPNIVPPHITLASKTGAVKLLMLVDPRAAIHVTSGVLPTNALTIPPDLTLPFLDTLSVTFPTRPVLSPNAVFDLPLPTEPGYAWSWVQHDQNQWRTTPLSATPSQTADPYVPQRVYSGWLKLTRQDS